MAIRIILLVCAAAVGQTWACDKCGDMNHQPNNDMAQQMMQFMMNMQGGGMNMGGGGGGVDYEEMVKKEREEQEMEAEKIQEQFESMLEKFKKQKHMYAKTMLGEMIMACQCQRAVMQGAPLWIMDSFMRNTTDEMVSDDWEPKNGEELKKYFFKGLFSNLCAKVHVFLERVTLISVRVEALKSGVTLPPPTGAGK